MQKTKKVPRNGYALAAKMRHAGPFHHKLDPRGGSKNKQAELLEEAETERKHCHNGSTCLLGAKSQGGDGCICECAVCLGYDPHSD